MEEKKSLKIRLSTVIYLFIIFILIIALVGIWYYYNYVKIVDNNISQNHILQTNNNTNNEIENDFELNNNLAKSIIEKCLNFAAHKEGSYVGFLEELNLVDKLEIDYNQSISVQGTTLYKTNIKYNDYKNKLLTYMSEKLFAYNFSHNFVESNGYLYFEGDIGSSGYSYKVQEVTLESKNNGQYIYLAKCPVSEPGGMSVEYIKATIVKENNIFVLDEYTRVQNNKQYSEITKKLENGDLLLVEEAMYNDDDTYTLKGEIISIANEGITEYPSYKKTSKYMQITLPLNTKCTYIVNEPEGEVATDTVSDVFSSQLYYGAGEGPCFNFDFENGKCISVYEVATGH